jgi:preprotein translocase subunit SecF
VIPINLAFIFSFVALAVCSIFYIKYSIPGFLIIICAFADLFMTLSIVNIIGMELSTAGIVAFLMLIGYSVDTDILLTTRVLKRKGESVNSRIFNSFKTGITMTLTSLSVVFIGLLITSSFSEVFFQLFSIIAIGLTIDIFNTWVTNVCLIKWYTEHNKLD